MTEERRDKMPRTIMHIDFDYFYAQCEEIRMPSLKAKPLVVCVFSGRTKDSGVVSTANYLAREYGVRSGIPIKTAQSRLGGVPDAAFLPLDLPYYAQVSDSAMSLIRAYGNRFEQAGIDECYLDVTAESKSFEEARESALQIKNEIRHRLTLTCSIGVAPNKLVAKIASDFQKPDGLTIVDPDSVSTFLAGLNVAKIGGIGPKTAARLAEMGATTISQIAALTQFRLAEAFGKKNATFIFNAARGIDEEPVVDSGEKKQLVRIVTLRKDATSSQELRDSLRMLCSSIIEVANARKLSFRTAGVLVVLANLEQKSRSKTLKTHTNNAELLYSTTTLLLDDLMGRGDLVVRRLGVRLSDLESTAGQNTMSEFIGVQ